MSLLLFISFFPLDMDGPDRQSPYRHRTNPPSHPSTLVIASRRPYVIIIPLITAVIPHLSSVVTRLFVIIRQYKSIDDESLHAQAHHSRPYLSTSSYHPCLTSHPSLPKPHRTTFPPKHIPLDSQSRLITHSPSSYAA